MSTGLRHTYRIVGSIAFSLAILALMWRWVGSYEAQSPLSLQALWAELSLGIVSIYLFTTLSQAFFRALRYRLLIRAHQPEDLPGVGHMYLVTLIRNMLVDMLPARLGELSYIAMLNRRYRVNAGACVASLTVSFVFDLIALMVLVVGLLCFQQFQADLVGRLPVAVVVLTLVSLSAVICIYPLFRYVAPKASSLILEKKTGTLWVRFGKLIVLINEALQATAKAGILLPTFGYSLLVRGFIYSGLFALFLATAHAFRQFGGVHEHGAGTILTALLSAEGAASLPLPAFMGFGTYEAGGTAALTLLGFSSGNALIMMLAIHVLSQIIDYSLGAAAGVFFFLKPAARAADA